MSGDDLSVRLPPGQGVEGGVGGLLYPVAVGLPRTWITLVCGVILGIISAKVTAAITPKPKAAPEAA